MDLFKCRVLSQRVYIVQILYKDSEHVDGAAAEAETSASVDDGGVLCLCRVRPVAWHLFSHCCRISQVFFYSNFKVFHQFLQRVRIARNAERCTS